MVRLSLRVEVQGLTKSQVEVATLPWGLARDGKEIYDRRFAREQVPTRRFCGLHPLYVRFREGFHSGARTLGGRIVGNPRAEHRPRTLAPKRLGRPRTGFFEEIGGPSWTLYRRGGILPRFLRHGRRGHAWFLCDEHKFWRVTQGNVFPAQLRGYVSTTRSSLDT